METEQPNPTHELEAMKKIADALSKLDEAAIRRVLRWAGDAFGAKITTRSTAESQDLARNNGSATTDPSELIARYPTIADFYAAVGPTQDSDKALVLGYWTQVLKGQGEFDAQSINKELKHLGYGVSNITSAFNALMGRRPQLAIQTKKSGTTKQARKSYRLTVEGQRAVERMLRQE